ncbi:MAG TPA: hypothetical protein VGC56_07440 [Allosphingosinicella sp.]
MGDGHESSLFYSDESGVERLKETVERFAKDVCRAQAVPIKIDEFICAEVHARAKETLGFHKIKEYSVYKEVAHVGFWINRLKPLRIDSPMNVFRVLEMARGALDEWTKGRWTTIEQKARSAEETLSRKLDFPVNEHVVVSLVMDLVEAAQLAHAEKLGGVTGTDFLTAIEDNKKRAPWLRNRLESSLRDHNHSARGFATLVEATFRTRCEHD